MAKMYIDTDIWRALFVQFLLNDRMRSVLPACLRQFNQSR